MNYLFWGDNQYALSARINELISAHEKEYGTQSVERLDGENIESAELHNLSARSLFETHRLVVVSDLSLNKKVAHLITEVIDALPDFTSIVFKEQKVKKNTTYYKELLKHSEAKEFSNNSDSDLVKWITVEANKLSSNIDHKSSRELIDRVGPNQLLLSNEIRKLATFNNNISHESIVLLVEQKPDDDVFELIELVGKGNVNKAAERYKELRRAQTEPYYVMNMISWQLTNMSVAVANRGKTSQQIAADAGMSPYVIQKAVAVSKQLSQKTMTKMIDAAAKTDLDLKSSKAEADQLMEQLISRLGLLIKTS